MQNKHDITKIQTNSKKRRMKIITLAVAGLLIIGGGTEVYLNANASTTSSLRIRYMTAEKGEIKETVSASGTVQAVHSSNLSFSSSGKITNIYVKVGDVVKAGQTLATIDPSVAQAQYDQAQANLAVAESKLSQAEANQADSTTIQVDKATVEQAQVSVQQAQIALDGTTIQAPFSGVITAVNGDVGEQAGSGGVSSNTNSSSGGSGGSGNSGGGGASGNSGGSSSSGNSGVISINDSNSGHVQVVAQVAQSDIGKVKVGQSAQFTSDAYTGQTFQGTVASISPVASTSNGITTYDVTFNVSNTNNDLKPGMTTAVVITVSDHKNVLTVPSAAIKTIGGQDGVYVPKNSSVSDPSQATMNDLQFTPVTIGAFSGNEVEITSGLTEGQKVAIVTQLQQANGSNNTSGRNSRNQNGFGSFGGNGGYGGGFGGNGGNGFGGSGYRGGGNRGGN